MGDFFARASSSTALAMAREASSLLNSPDEQADVGPQQPDVDGQSASRHARQFLCDSFIRAVFIRHRRSETDGEKRTKLSRPSHSTRKISVRR